MLQTWLTDRFRLAVPVIGAPMAGPGEGALAAAVSAAGGLGMFGVGASRSAAWVAEQAAVAGAGGRPFGVGLAAWILDDDDAQLDAVIAARPALVSVSFGTIEPYVARLREAGITVTIQAGNLDDAVRAERAGVDLLVARGGEAGGHGRDEVSTLTLLQMVLDRVEVPVVAAGGIGTARGLAAVLAAGAVGAWVGTAFLGCREASNSPAARQQLFAADGAATAYGRVFDIAQRLGWPPEYGGRALRNRFFDEWVGREGDLAADRDALEQYAAARRDQDFDVAVIYAGQGAALLRSETTAGEVVAAFAADA
jgi:nitronate monooxygenase